jgi:hypothetical protein
VITRRRLVISVILAGTLALFIYSFSITRPASTPIIFKNSAVVTVSPLPAALVLRESSIGITLSQGYALATANVDGLSISTNGATTGIPLDQLQIQPGQNEFTFAPAPGRQFSELPVGRVCAVAEIEKTAEPNLPPSSFSWCFQTQ